MRARGAPEDVIAATRKKWDAQNPPPEPIEVFPENVDAFRVFWMLRAQWEHPGPEGGRCTVPLGEVDVAIRRLKVAKGDDCFERVSLMLLAARKVKLERLEKAAAARRHAPRK